MNVFVFCLSNIHSLILTSCIRFYKENETPPKRNEMSKSRLANDIKKLQYENMLLRTLNKSLREENYFLQKDLGFLRYLDRTTKDSLLSKHNPEVFKEVTGGKSKYYLVPSSYVTCILAEGKEKHIHVANEYLSFIAEENRPHRGYIRKEISFSELKLQIASWHFSQHFIKIDRSSVINLSYLKTVDFKKNVILIHDKEVKLTREIGKYLREGIGSKDIDTKNLAVLMKRYSEKYVDSKW